MTGARRRRVGAALECAGPQRPRFVPSRAAAGDLRTPNPQKPRDHRGVGGFLKTSNRGALPALTSFFGDRSFTVAVFLAFGLEVVVFFFIGSLLFSRWTAFPALCPPIMNAGHSRETRATKWVPSAPLALSKIVNKRARLSSLGVLLRFEIFHFNAGLAFPGFALLGFALCRLHFTAPFSCCEPGLHYEEHQNGRPVGAVLPRDLRQQL